MATSHELDEHAAKHIHEAINTLKRAFATGLGKERDFPETLKAHKELCETLDKEAAVETSIAIRERLGEQQQQHGGGGGGEEARSSGKRVCVFVDGSYNSITALRWAIEHVVGAADDLFLVTVTPYEDYTADATRILQESYDYAANAGVRSAQLHVRTLVAKGSSRTQGVGESIKQYVEEQGMSLVVLGSRGLGSIKRNVMALVGMGSVSDFCVQNLKCPIIVMKEQPDGSTKAQRVDAGAGEAGGSGAGEIV